MTLSNREGEILQLHSIGLTPEEIAERLFISRETVRKTISNIKIKLKLQKASELTAYYWCEFFGTSLAEQRKSILSSCACLIILFALSFDNYDKRRLRFKNRKEGIESVEIFTTI